MLCLADTSGWLFCRFAIRSRHLCPLMEVCYTSFKLRLTCFFWQTLCAVLCVKKLVVCVKKLCCQGRHVKYSHSHGFHLHSCTQLCHMFGLLRSAKQRRCCITNFNSAGKSGCGLDSRAMDDCWHYKCLVFLSSDHQLFLQPLQQYCLAVTDMFFDYPFDVDANDRECVQQYGIHSQYNWAAYK